MKWIIIYKLYKLQREINSNYQMNKDDYGKGENYIA